MNKYKQVKLKDLNEFRNLLKLSKDANLLNYFDSKIMKVDNDKLNDLKRIIYTCMKRCDKDSNENKQHYLLYQQLKNNNINYDEALEVFMNIK